MHNRIELHFHALQGRLFRSEDAIHEYLRLTEWKIPTNIRIIGMRVSIKQYKD